MRKLSVLTSFAALALLAAPVANADTLLAVDPPDVNLAPGTTASDTFDLDDFFNSTAGDISYTVSGGSANADNVATVDGLADVGSTTFSVEGTNGTDTLTVSSSVFVSTFNITNGPDINNNNRWVGVDGGNKFAQFLAPGGSFSSSVPLGNLPQGGGGGTGSPGGVTGGGVTGAAALIQTIASVGLTTDLVTGLRERTINGDVASGSNGQLTVELNADGSYTVTAGDNFSGNHIVTLGATAAGTDAVHVLASAATELGAPFVGTHTATADAPALVFGDGSPIPVSGSMATVTVYYQTSDANAVIAAVGFDGALAGETVSFTNSSGAQIDASGTVKGLATSFTVTSGSVIPAVQVASSGGSVTVDVVRMTVASAGPLHDFALNPNHTVPLSVSADSTDGWIADILGSGASGPAADSASNFASAGSLALNGSGGIANAATQTLLPGGEVAAECYVQSGGGEGAFALALTDGAGFSLQATKLPSQLPADGWQKVTVSGTVASGGVDAAFLVVQAAGFDALVDDVVVRAIDDKPEHFDADLLGG